MIPHSSCLNPTVLNFTKIVPVQYCVAETSPYERQHRTNEQLWCKNVHGGWNNPALEPDQCDICQSAHSNMMKSHTGKLKDSDVSGVCCNAPTQRGQTAMCVLLDLGFSFLFLSHYYSEYQLADIVFF